ncbi:helix-turn-helix domain-containing protein [Microbacterium thalassium]|uniref:DNA-binding transcriptional ArsR family regulator n=1 Tax=Microbacterium thalassium TaxID=362649 RepID=A0A7X0KT41_9MICO|nr:helix-turn-helix domain-containing protein [Microbacterium thalassium]MBB6389719.1 DNA-binding transcriptional ArsR family regulator [Microbacterium thalassium]
MTSSRSDLVLHPVRLRIVLECSSNDVTARELADRMPDVPQATLYRHISALADAGVLRVVSERRIRGGVERTFRVADGAAGLDSGDAAAMSADEHREGFAVFAGALISAFSRYLDLPDARPSEDPVGYRQVALWLSEDELRAMVAALSGALQPFLGNEPTPDRRRVLFSTVLMPDAGAEASA